MLKDHILRFLDFISFRLYTTQFFIDSPKSDYQPLPWLGINTARRGIGTEERFKAIECFLNQRGIRGGSSLDLGSNLGFFSLKLAEKGFCAFGVERTKTFRKLGLMAAEKITGNGTFCPIPFDINLENVKFLPNPNVTLCLSIWHHWVKFLGFESASSILKTIWDKTIDVMFFESGESEIESEYGVPFNGELPSKWLEGYLSKLPNAKVACLGKFDAFPPKALRGTTIVQRHLFVVEKT